jgi:hypothetical protein
MFLVMLFMLALLFTLYLTGLMAMGFISVRCWSLQNDNDGLRTSVPTPNLFISRSG